MATFATLMRFGFGSLGDVEGTSGGRADFVEAELL